jgi:hypothetical protein
MSKYRRGQREVDKADDRISRLEEDAIEEVRQRRFLKAMSMKEQIHLTDDERYELAQMIMGVDKDDGGSWKDLNPKQLHDLITMMEGYAFISYLISQRMDS